MGKMVFFRLSRVYYISTMLKINTIKSLGLILKKDRNFVILFYTDISFKKRRGCNMKKLFSFLSKKTKQDKRYTSDNINVSLDNIPIENSLEKNLNSIKEVFSYQINEDFIFRKIHIKAFKKDGVLLYLNGMIKKSEIEDHILEPLMGNTLAEGIEDPINKLTEEVLHSVKAIKIFNLSRVIEEILKGNTVLIIDGYKDAIAVNTTEFPYRDVSKAENEIVVKGPNESFSESHEVNRGLIRKSLRNKDLVSECISIGKTTTTDTSVMYIKGITNAELVKNVKSRLKSIRADGIESAAILEQHIEERPYSLIPSVLYTERPDRAISFLKEGNVVILCENSPACLVVPATFWAFFHTSEDSYQRWAYGNFIRFIRVIAIFIALLAPALYIAMTNHHEEMLPLDLLLSIAATREAVPFPSIVEVFIMEISFELVREAGIRVPSPIGPTIGIVGALILGQAAVEANIVSPIMVIIVGITGISSFAIPDTSLNYGIRIVRFAFTILAISFGMLGTTAGGVLLLAYASTLKSFGVPFFSPVVPYFKSSKDTIFRSPAWKQWLRPFNLEPQDKVKREPPERRSDQ